MTRIQTPIRATERPAGFAADATLRPGAAGAAAAGSAAITARACARTGYSVAPIGDPSPNEPMRM